MVDSGVNRRLSERVGFSPAQGLPGVLRIGEKYYWTVRGSTVIMHAGLWYREVSRDDISLLAIQSESMEWQGVE
jgi:hypothetical protein